MQTFLSLCKSFSFCSTSSTALVQSDVSFWRSSLRHWLTCSDRLSCSRRRAFVSARLTDLRRQTHTYMQMMYTHTYRWNKRTSYAYLCCSSSSLMRALSRQSLCSSLILCYTQTHIRGHTHICLVARVHCTKMWSISAYLYTLIV